MHSVTLISSFLALFALVAKAAPAPAPDDTYADPDNIIFNFEFEDRNIDQWMLMYDGDFEFFMDVQQSVFADDRLTWALRVGEVTTTPEVEGIVKYLPSLHLEAGANYQIAFSLRSSLIGSDGSVVPGLGSDFSPLQMVVFNANGNIWSNRLGKGIEMKNEWYRYHYTFTADEGAAALPAWFGCIVHASGKGVDWWFDDISLIKF